jgi:hypothetical protein
MRDLLFVLVAIALCACTGTLVAEPADQGESPSLWFAAPSSETLCRGRTCVEVCGQPGRCPPPSDEVDAGAELGDPDAGWLEPEPELELDPEPDPEPEPEPGACVRARRLWFEDFETGNYERWTGQSYFSDWGNHCQDNDFSTLTARSGRSSHRSEITCRSHDSVHRGYGGLQFSGDEVLPYYTNRGTGTDAPNGIVNTFWARLDTPYEFGSGRWFSFWTINNDCTWGDRVITLGLEDATRRLTPAHVKESGGTVTFSPGAPGFPFGEWVRVTIYVNYHRGEMHVWQNGESVVHGTFRRPTTAICHWHWGAYASGDNDDVVLFEDDNSLWKLEERWTDFSTEPWFEGTTRACD